MQDENGDNRADDDSGQRTTQDGEKDEIPTKRDILVDAAEIAGGIIFGGIAVALAEAGFHFWSFVVGLLALCQAMSALVWAWILIPAPSCPVRASLS